MFENIKFQCGRKLHADKKQFEIIYGRVIMSKLLKGVIINS